MGSKKIIAASLVVAVLFASVGIYYYKAKIKADTQETLNGTRLQMIDASGNTIKQNIPLELSFKATVRVCKVTKVLFAKVSKCRWEDRNFKRVALTSNDGTYTVGTESYRPLTQKEAQLVVQNLAAEKAGRTLNADEQARLDRVSAQVAGSGAQPTNAQVEGMLGDAFKDYVPPATDETKTIGKGPNPIGQLVQAAATTSAAVAAGSAATVLAASSTSLIPNSVNNIAKDITSSVASGAKWLFTNTSGLAVLAEVIILTSFVSTKTNEKWFTLLSADVRAAGDLYTGDALTLYYQKDKDTTSDKYVKSAKFAVDLNDFDKAFYSQSADQLYSQFIDANSSMSDISKNNYKQLLAANVAYLEYARLHGYVEANANKSIADQIKALANIQIGSGATTGLNLLKNGSFESGFDSWVSTPDVGSNTIVDSSSSFSCSSGAKCVKIVANKSTNQHIVQQVGKLTKGKKYTFSVDFLANNLAEGQINIYEGKSGKGYGVILNGNGGVWKTASVTIPVENDDNDFYVFVYGDKHGAGTGTVYYDNFNFGAVN